MGSNGILRRCCDFRRPLDFILTHLNKLNAGITDSQTNVIVQLKSALHQLNKARKINVELPDPSSVGSFLNTIFYDGSLSNVEYKWTTPTIKSSLVTPNTRKFGYCEISLALPNGRIFLDAGNLSCGQDGQDRFLQQLIDTLTHEQLHIFLWRYMCNGIHCEAHSSLQDQHKLCRYMFARCVSLFSSVTYMKADLLPLIHNNAVPQAEVFRHDAYTGHGPLFQMVLERIHGIVPIVMGTDYVVKRTGLPGEMASKTGSELKMCFSYHVDNYETMQKRMWKLIKQSGTQNPRKSRIGRPSEPTEGGKKPALGSDFPRHT